MDNFVFWLKGLSPSQVLLLAIIIVIVIVIICVVKKIAKFIVFVIAVISFCIYFGLVTPDQLMTSSEILSDKLTSEELVNLTLVSDAVSISSGTIEVKLGDTWYCFDDITRVRVDKDGVYTLEVQEQEIEVTDSGVEALIKIVENH